MADRFDELIEKIQETRNLDRDSAIFYLAYRGYLEMSKETIDLIFEMLERKRINE